MTLLNTADAIYIGDRAADRVYLGANLVWEPAGGAWTPAEISIGMFGWWDASESSTLHFLGANLNQWDDKSGHGWHLKPTRSGGPTLSSINGLGALAFATGQGIATAGPAQYDDFTVCAVWRPGNTVGDYERIVDHGYAAGWWTGRTGGTQTWGGGVLDGPGTGYGQFTTFADNQVHQISSKRAGDQHAISANGGATLLTRAVTTTRTAAQRVTVGDDQSDLSPLNGLVAESLIWSRALSAADLAKTEGYLAHKWGIAAKLPAGHPYKSAPPGPTPPATGPTETLVISYTPGSGRNDYTGEVGWRAGIGIADVPFKWIGIQYSGGNRTPRRVFVYEWFTNTPIAQADIDVSDTALGGWAWASVPLATMLANGYYGIALKVTAGDGQTWTNPGPTAVKPSIVNVYSIYRDNITVPGFANGVIDTQYVGLDLGW